jgi:hypothetical protein
MPNPPTRWVRVQVGEIFTVWNHERLHSRAALLAGERSAYLIKLHRMICRQSLALSVQLKFSKLCTMWMVVVTARTLDQSCHVRLFRNNLLTQACAYRRVADKTIRNVLRKGLDAWQGVIEGQDHKKAVLTRILIRIQVCHIAFLSKGPKQPY